MADDYAHWERLGLFGGFESYVQQEKEDTSFDPEIRRAWIQEMIARHKAKREGGATEVRKAAPAATAGQPANCRELLKMMPLGFDPEAARAVEAVYQFDVTGKDAFQAYLKISGGTCRYCEGAADAPGVVIRTPGEVWMAIAKGDLDGQHAFIRGDYTAEGDLSLLIQLRTLFPGRSGA